MIFETWALTCWWKVLPQSWKRTIKREREQMIHRERGTGTWW